MASALGVAVETVKMHLKHLYHKTQTHSQQELISLLLNFCATHDDADYGKGSIKTGRDSS
jgi:hypothetical protein